jgi:membrane fusion protein (multidrug efflux system)
MEVRTQDVVEWIRGIGSVSADKSVTLAAEVGARVAETFADVGDLVEEGDVLARLDDERLRIARDLARAEVEIAKSNLANAGRDARRQADLFKDGIISEEMVEESDLDVDVFVGELEVAEARLAAAERDLSDATIKSPIYGEITRRRMEVGELIQPGSPVFDIADIRHIKVDVNVSEREITKIRKGQSAEIAVDGYPGVTFHGKVHTIGVEADMRTRNFPIEILAINDKPEKLLPGFIGRVRIRGRTFEDAIFLPREVIVDRDGSPTVYVATGDKASERPVVLGFEDRGKILISEGLRAGDKLVVTGQETLRDGSKIIIR